MERFEQDFAPVLARWHRLDRGLPISRDAKLNAQLKKTGADKIPKVKIVNPSEGLQPCGPSLKQILKQIAANPRNYRHLAKGPAKTKSVVGVARKTAQDLIVESRMREKNKDDKEEET